MKQNDKKRFAALMAIFEEVFAPDKPISKERIKVYFEILSDIPIENLELAVKDLMNKKRYPIFPLPSEIRKAAGFDEEEDVDIKALEAFREACNFVLTYGRPESKREHGNPLIEETIRLCFGGWEYFADTDPKNETWDRKQFLDIYKRLFQDKKRIDLLSAAKIIRQLKENREDMKTLEEKK